MQSEFKEWARIVCATKWSLSNKQEHEGGQEISKQAVKNRILQVW